MLFYEPYICKEKLAKNDKGKEEADEIVNDECVNMEALKLWRSDIETFVIIINTHNLN